MKRHIEEITLTKRQKTLLEQLARKQLDMDAPTEEREAVEAQVRQKFNSQRRRGEDIFELPEQSIAIERF